MSMIVHQGLPSFLDNTHLNESRTLRLKLPSSSRSHSLEMAICTALDSDSKILFTNPSSEHTSKMSEHGFSFLQTLTNERRSSTAYVHPLVKRATSLLSDKSLELCTENLGSETGTDVLEDENVSFSGERKIDTTRSSHVSRFRKMLHKKTFPVPPPLSTMIGPERVQVRSVRENGRLVLQAVKIQPKVSCFEADRSNGRLRLRLVNVENSLKRDCFDSDSNFKIIKK